jgi:exodeoxyribonuclease VII small subunit
VSDRQDGEPIKISFERGMARLEEISNELDAADASLDRTIELMREGKGLERALRGYLDRAAERLAAIERGEMQTMYEIVSIADPPAPSQPPADTSPSDVAPAQDDLFGRPDEPF